MAPSGPEGLLKPRLSATGVAAGRVEATLPVSAAMKALSAASSSGDSLSRPAALNSASVMRSSTEEKDWARALPAKAADRTRDTSNIRRMVFSVLVELPAIAGQSNSPANAGAT